MLMVCHASHAIPHDPSKNLMSEQHHVCFYDVRNYAVGLFTELMASASNLDGVMLHAMHFQNKNLISPLLILFFLF